MSQSTVDGILNMIDALPESDRQLLEERLAERLEKEWLSEAAHARNEARARGIDQSAIDEALQYFREESGLQ